MVAKRPPRYDLKVFVRACSRTGAVFVRKDARQDAKEHFSLYPASVLLGFIAAGKLAGATHDNTSTIDVGNDAGKDFDAYVFEVGPGKHAYIAFYLNDLGKWVIKSFHPPEYGEHGKDLSHSPFKQLLGDKFK